MTAYVHIGTMKTGTTTIQEFLVNNFDELLKQGFLYPKSILYQNKHSPLGVFAYKEYKYEAYTIAYKLNNLTLIKEHNKNQIQLLKNELKCHKDKKIIFSSEGIQVYLTKKEEVEYFKKLLESLGIKHIYILVYIRNPIDAFCSLYNQRLKYPLYNLKHSESSLLSGECNFICNHIKTIKTWSSVFGKNNIIVKLFDRDEFYCNDLLRDFANSINLEWQTSFKIPFKKNESLNLIGIELLTRINHILPLVQDATVNKLRGDIIHFFHKFFLSNIEELSFRPSKKIYYHYEKYFEESNEWVRKEFFSHKERLFPKKDLSNYKENYELKEMKPEYWDKIANFTADLVSSKNQTIQDNLTQIQNLNQNIKLKEQTIQDNLTQIQNLNQNIKLKEQTIQDNLTQIQNLNQNIKLKEQTIQDNLTQIQLSNKQLSFQTKYGTAKSRIQNQLSYKLGQAMIVNSKSILGYIRMPFVLSYIKDKHKQEQKIYQEKIKKNPLLALPPLKSYLDYKEALKEKECFTYKLGQALIQANKTWYKGGYIKMWFEIVKLKREFKNKKI